jgi:hypothetical protein
MRQLSRKPFVLMLKDDSGEVDAVPLDPTLVNSDNALIVLDEYNDTCWAWIGRKVNMPTRMHALRMARGLQKSGFKVGVTTIGLSLSKFVEMMEKDEGDSQVANDIASFKAALDGRWNFDDRVLAFRKEHEAKAIAGAPAPKPEPALEAPATAEPAPEPKPAPVPPKVADVPLTMGDKKAAHLLWAAVKNSELAYVERVEHEGTPGFKIEVPGVMVIEVAPKGNYLEITPSGFGDSDEAKKIKSDYESMTKKL